MFDAITNFVVYLRECIENSEDPDEIARLRNVLDNAETLKERIDSVTMEQVGA